MSSNPLWRRVLRRLGWEIYRIPPGGLRIGDMQRLLLRAGVDADFLAETPEVSLPADAAAYLTEDNSRLRELREAYRQPGGPKIESSIWSAERVRRDLPLRRFRDDCAFLWQKQDMNTPAALVLTALYLNEGGLTSLLQRLGEDGLFGCYTVEFEGMRVSRDLLDSVCEIRFLERMMGKETLNGAVLLDIGSGYGRFAHRLVQARPEVGKILCADAIPESNFLCEFYLRFRGVAGQAQMVPLPEVSRALADSTIDVAVNIHSFSECTFQSIAWWVEKLAERAVPRLLIVPNGDVDGGRRLMSNEPDGGRKDFLPLLQEAGYKLVASEPKYAEPQIQRYGVSPTWYHWLER